MSLYPVIMCGGAGTRLWPASRPSRPKQFVPLAGNRTLFQETALRVAPLAEEGGGRLIVVGGVDHRDAIIEQLAEIGVVAHALLEPEARDSAAAMAAAAAWVFGQDADAVLAFVASDHHIPDHEAFRDAVRAAADGARSGRIVTLGVRPTQPSSAYGYIKPTGRGLSAVEAFVEKPDRDLAARYIADGYLWNSGNFIATASALLTELRTYAPGVAAAASAALPTTSGVAAVQTLTSAFTAAQRISIDYAVMEKTRLASVLEVDFAWSDLGAWDAIAASGEGDVGTHIFEDAEGCLARAPDGVLVAVLGVRNLAIVVEHDAVLVSDLNHAQEVKRVVERIREMSPAHLDFPKPNKPSLGQDAVWFAEWLRLHALPSWSVHGLREDGAFEEVLSLDSRAIMTTRRARVQARQIYVFARAGELGWRGPWRGAVRNGLAHMRARFVRDDGLVRTLLSAADEPLDDTAFLYDQAFVLFALAAAHQAGASSDAEAAATRLRDDIKVFAMENGGMREAGDHPYQANAHMHLLEACLAWETAGGDEEWARYADRIVAFALERFVDDSLGCVREFYDADWKPAAGADGRLVEPGHQFEWAWLLTRYSALRGDAEALATARRLYAYGQKGVDLRAQVAVDALNVDGAVRSARARLWPQTEWLKAALILAEHSRDGERASLLRDAQQAMRALKLYLTPEGLWRDKRLAQGGFIDEPAPASSFYHLMGAFDQLRETTGRLGVDAVEGLGLG